MIVSILAAIGLTSWLPAGLGLWLWVIWQERRAGRRDSAGTGIPCSKGEGT